MRQLRIKRGLTQQQLAERLGYKTNSYISDVESGHFIPSREKLKKIARALDVPFKVLEDMLLESRLETLGIRELSFSAYSKIFLACLRRIKRHYRQNDVRQSLPPDRVLPFFESNKTFVKDLYRD